MSGAGAFVRMLVVLVMLGPTSALLPPARPALAATFTVTSTGDGSDTDVGDGACEAIDVSVPRCTLRAAIQEANFTLAADTIAFNIPAGAAGCTIDGVCTIAPASALPTITRPVTIDGYTQPGASPNTSPHRQPFNTVLKIELNGANAGEVSGLVIEATSSVRGLAGRRDSTGDGQPHLG